MQTPGLNLSAPYPACHWPNDLAVCASFNVHLESLSKNVKVQKYSCNRNRRVYVSKIEGLASF